MLKKHMAACLVATAFAVAPAFAQTSTAPSGSTDRPTATGSGSPVTGSPAMQPGASGSSPPAGGSSTMPAPSMAQGSMQGQFMTQMEPNQMMASKLIGTTVVSANNESIGDVNDVIVDRNGQAMAVVIGVGGFLGIGEKDVAVPFRSLEFASREQMNRTVSGTGDNVATTGSTGSRQGAAASDGGAPDRVVLRMTKAELQAAPSFRVDGRNGTATGTTSTPRQ